MRRISIEYLVREYDKVPIPDNWTDERIEDFVYGNYGDEAEWELLDEKTEL